MGMSFSINDTVKSYREKIVLKTLQLEFNCGYNSVARDKCIEHRGAVLLQHINFHFQKWIFTG